MLIDKAVSSKAFQPYLSKFIHVYTRTYLEDTFTMSLQEAVLFWVVFSDLLLLCFWKMRK